MQKLADKLISHCVFCGAEIVGCKVLANVGEDGDDIVLAAHYQLVLLAELLQNVEEEPRVGAIYLQIEEAQHLDKDVDALAVLEESVDF